MRFIGLDAGSVAVKLVLLDAEGSRLEGLYERHRGHPLTLAYRLLKESIESNPGEQLSLSVTGSAGRLIAATLGIGYTNELVAQACSTQRLYPDVRTVFELGGEDSKLILLGDAGIQDYSMNSVCAAGTGSFLDQQAERLRLTIEEFSALAVKSERPSRIAGRCSVFAKSDMIHQQQIATPVEDIVAGLCFAVARNFKGSIVRGRTIWEPVSFHGGVAANQGMVRAFREVFGFKDLRVPEDHALMGAIGAALKGLDEGVAQAFDPERLRSFIESSRFSETGHKPLVAGPSDDFFARHGSLSRETGSEQQPGEAGDQGFPAELTQAYLGIDIGSISTNLAVIDRDGRLLAKRYLMTAGRPIDAVRRGLAEIQEEIGDSIEVLGVGTTGSGRYMIADYVGADIVKNEITAQATAAAFIDRNVDTIFEIGGQDSKYISMRDGVIVDFEMNKACAAGTGSFLEEQAEKLDTSVKGEFAACACSADNPCHLGERCTVFMENSLMANLQKGADKNDLLAGLAYSIVQNYINKVVAGKAIGKNIFFQGGVAFNKSVVAAFEKFLGKPIKVPPHHDVTGAIGMALIARGHMEQNGPRPSGFKGFGLSKRPYEVSSFECRACPNVCEINRVKIEGEEGHLFYGGRCERYDVRKKRGPSSMEDLFAFRDGMLWKEHEARLSAAKEKDRPKIGIPYVFFFHDYLPFWTTLLWELGFEAEVSPRTNREVVDTGIESVLADTCFPVKVAHGHIRHLIDKGVDTILIPSFINMNTEGDESERGFACPLTQTLPYAARVAHPGTNVIAPLIDLRTGRRALIREIAGAFRPLGKGRRAVEAAVAAAELAQERFLAAVRDKGKEVLSGIREKTVVIVGRPYNAFDSGVNLGIPKKLSDINVLAMPMDFLDLEQVRITDKWPNMYWRSGQRILRAARAIREHPDLYAIYIGNFSCGPDSFILRYFEEEMQGKPFLHIEIDEHSADAGAITRCEAFLDSIGNYRPGPREQRQEKPVANTAPALAGTGRAVRTVYIPRMADHALALAAAFEKCGVPAVVMPESDREAVDLGRRFVSGKECYPCTVTTGDMVRKALSPGFRPEESAFFMPSGSGPCRFGQYNVFHRLVLDELGHADVPIFAPNQDASFYEELGIVGSDFSLNSWRGIIAIELLQKCLHETRPYEVEPGAADALYKSYLEKAYFSLRGLDGNIEDLLRSAKQDFGRVPRRPERRPVIGIVGEIFVRSNRFSNEDIVRKIEALGGEVWLAPVEEWIYYINYMGTRKALIKRDKSAIIDFLVKRFFQKRIEHRFGRLFKGFLRTLEEPDVKDVLRKASPYLHDSFEGEAILSIGKSIDLIERGVAGIVNAMPFGCMPGTIVTTLMRGVTRDYGIPFISIPYDGTESPTTAIQLETFMNQAKEHHLKHSGV